MTKNRNRWSEYKIIKTYKSGKKVVIGYLSNKDVEEGLDSHFDLLGFEIVAI